VTRSVVIDTNVLAVANELHAPAGVACVEACNGALRKAQRSVVLIDDNHAILSEYQTYCSHAGQPGLGDAFFKWLWNNQGNPTRCRQIRITPNASRVFDEFPEDPDLSAFDLDDRKFVAVAVASGLNPDILNASDTDWWISREALYRNGVRIRFLCPELMTNGD
jgi:hypothetical protein